MLRFWVLLFSPRHHLYTLWITCLKSRPESEEPHLPIGLVTIPSEIWLLLGGNKLESRNVDIISSVASVVVTCVVRLDIEISSFGSRRFSISRDIMVTDILCQGLVDFVGRVKVQYTYSRKWTLSPSRREQPAGQYIRTGDS